MHPVQSRNIRAIGYDEENELLYITFNAGFTYQYEKVGQGAYNSLLEAARDGRSVGKVFWAAINGQFEHKVIG